MPLWITRGVAPSAANAGSRSSDTSTTSSAVRSSSRAAPARSSSAAPWWVASTGGRRGPRPSRPAAAATDGRLGVVRVHDVRAKVADERRLAQCPFHDPERRAPALGQHEPPHAGGELRVERAGGAGDGHDVTARGQPRREPRHHALGTPEAHARTREQDPHATERYSARSRCRPFGL